MKSTKSHRRKILILFPCSGRKIKSEPDEESFEPDEEKKVIDLIVNMRSHLLSGRREISSCFDTHSTRLATLDRYNGSLYRVDNFRESVRKAYLEKNVHILIMSGAYGILTPSERIRYYNKEMDANYWIHHGLPKVIQEYVEKNKITHVYGFFSLTSDYIEIMRSIDWLKLKNFTTLEVVRTYYIKFKGKGGAQVIVPKETGRLIVSFIKSKFNQNNFYRNPFHGQCVKFIDHLLD